nr:FAD-dependent monooxygenase [Pseudonocardia acaciae]
MNEVLIIGGGIAGPVTAMALARAGIDSTVYEAYDRTADGVGAYLTFAVNGLDALAVLGLDELAARHAFATPSAVFRNGAGRWLGELPLGPARADGRVGMTIRRADLYRELRDEAIRRGVRVEYGKRLVHVERTETGVLAHFEDGSRAHGDALVGADGLRSRVRTVIDPLAPAGRYTGLLNTAGYADGVQVDAKAGVANMYFGKRCFFCYFRNPNGQLWWFANPPRPAEPAPGELAALSPEAFRAELLDLFSVDDTPATEIIEATEEIVSPWGTYDYPLTPVWRRDRMVIIGDAAHATSPAAGQGASMACEDAVELARCLRDAPDPEDAFAAFERLRRDRVERIVAMGKRNGDQKAVGPVARVVRDLVLPVVFRRMARAGAGSTAWVYDYAIDWDAPIHERVSKRPIQ